VQLPLAYGAEKRERKIKYRFLLAVSQSQFVCRLCHNELGADVYHHDYLDLPRFWCRLGSVKLMLCTCPASSAYNCAVISLACLMPLDL
jgi:hypothetical protein